LGIDSGRGGALPCVKDIHSTCCELRHRASVRGQGVPRGARGAGEWPQPLDPAPTFWTWYRSSYPAGRPPPPSVPNDPVGQCSTQPSPLLFGGPHLRAREERVARTTSEVERVPRLNVLTAPASIVVGVSTSDETPRRLPSISSAAYLAGCDRQGRSRVTSRSSAAAAAPGRAKHFTRRERPELRVGGRQGESHIATPQCDTQNWGCRPRAGRWEDARLPSGAGGEGEVDLF
jgi:hypothetical protein